MCPGNIAMAGPAAHFEISELFRSPSARFFFLEFLSGLSDQFLTGNLIPF
jgi:hypothetical protein